MLAVAGREGAVDGISMQGRMTRGMGRTRRLQKETLEWFKQQRSGAGGQLKEVLGAGKSPLLCGK